MMATCTDCGSSDMRSRAKRCLACYQRRMASQKKMKSPYDDVDPNRWARLELYALFAERQIALPYRSQN